MLGFTLNEEQDAFRLAVRDWAARALAPRVEALEATETFPLDLFRELGRLGYLGVGISEEYGGSGGDMTMRCLLIATSVRLPPILIGQATGIRYMISDSPLT